MINYLYKDLNQDGISELVAITQNQHNTITFYDEDYRYIEEFPIQGNINVKWFYYHDVDHDGWDEIFFFFTKKDTRFLSSINLSQKKWLLKNFVLETLPAPLSNEPWDIRNIDCKFADFNHDGTDELIFFISAGYTLFPRKLYIFDISSKKITYTFSTTVFFRYLKVIDYDQDGNYEIILTSTAPGNIHRKVKYTDHNSWLMVFDQSLNFKIPPRKFYPYPSALFFLVTKEKEKNYLYLFSSSQSIHQKPLLIQKLNEKFEPIREIKIDFSYGTEPISYLSGANSYILVPVNNKKAIYKFNTNLKTIDLYNQRSRNFKICCKLSTKNLNTNFVIARESTYTFVDENFRELGSIPNAFMSSLTFQHYQKIFPQKMLFSNGKRTIFYNIEKSIFRKFWHIIGLFLFAIIFFSMNLLDKIISFYLFHYSYQNIVNFSGTAIAIFSRKGILISSNLAFKSLFVSPTIHKSTNFEQIFKKSVNYYNNLKQSFSSKEKTMINITRSDQIFSENRTMTIIPLRIFYLPIRYYIFIFEKRYIDRTSPKLMEWVDIIQKLAHDVKTPLSTLNVKIASMKMQFKENNLEGFNDDFNLLLSECKRIQESTNYFLKFASIFKLGKKKVL